MNNTFVFIVILSNLFFGTRTDAQRLDKFTAKTGSMNRNGKIIALPYSDCITYFGFFHPDTTATTNPKKNNCIKLYLNLLEDINEIGIRIISPVPENFFPDKGDQLSASYTFHENEKFNYFDPFIKLYKADTINPSFVNWILISENDNHNETGAQPSGKKNNALIRIFDPENTTLKTVLKGLYKIEILSVDSFPKSGSFILQTCNTSFNRIIKLSENPDQF